MTSVLAVVLATLLVRELLLALWRRVEQVREFWRDVQERRRRRVEGTERWHVSLGRGYETYVCVPIDPETGHGRGAADLAKLHADLDGVHWPGDPLCEIHSATGWGQFRYREPWKETLAEWLSRR